MSFKGFNVKERIFLLYMYFFAFITYFAIFINIFIGLDFNFNIKWLVTGTFCLVLSILAYKRLYSNIVKRVGIYVISFVLLPICWLTSSGLLSPALIYTPLIFIMINYLTHGKERVLLNVGEISLVMLLIWIFYNKIELYHMVSPKLQFYDWMVHTPLIFIFLAILLSIFEKAYEDERVINRNREEELQKLATTDFLTGLSNRNDMDEKLTLIHSIWERGIGEYSIILLDIDYFKAYNDLYGHIEGDQCLKRFGPILQNQLRRGTDWAFRYGGEEFLLILGITDSKGANFIAENIKRAIYKANIPHENSKVSFRVSASMGIATICKKDESPSDVIKRADNALYRAKESGRNQIFVN